MPKRTIERSSLPLAFGLWLAFAWSHAAAAHAQAIPVDIERFTPSTSSDGFLSLQPTRTPGPGRFFLGLMSGLELSPVTLDSHTQSQLRAIDSRTNVWLTGEVGIGGRAALSFVLSAFPYQHLTLAPATTDRGAGPQNVGLNMGDAQVQARYRLLGASSSKLDTPADGPGLALQAIGYVPSSAGNYFAGDMRLRAELDLLGDFQLLGAGIGAMVGVRHRFEDVVLPHQRLGANGDLLDDPIRFGTELTFGAALKMPLPPAPSIVVLVEARGATEFRSSRTTNVELDLGMRTQLGDFALTLAGGFGLASGIGTPDGRLLLGFLWSPPKSDSDNDGIPDGRDQCPPLPEDKDGFQDDDGCPDPDNDNDLVPDVDDLCPNVEALEGQDLDEDGCTDKQPGAKSMPKKGP